MATAASAFIGTIPEYYDHYLYRLIFDEYGADLARRVSVPPGGRVLETGAGTGIATRHLRSALPPDAHLVVTDLNEPMLEIARRKFDSTANMEFQTANAAQLMFPDASFDAVVCQFTVMFFPDKRAALRQAARVLKPGGTFVFNLWDSFQYNDIARRVDATLAGLFPSNPIAFYNTPFGYHRVDEVREVLSANGFGDLEISILPRWSGAATARDVATGFLMGTPACLQIAEQGTLPVEEVVNTVARDLAATFGEAPFRTRMQAIVVKAYRDSSPL